MHKSIPFPLDENLEERETKIEVLRQALKEGEQSGFTEYSLDKLIEELDSKDFA